MNSLPLITLLFLVLVRLILAEEPPYPDDEKCEKMGSMIIAHILNKTPFPDEYRDAYKMLKFTGSGLNDLGDYVGCKSLPFAQFYTVTASWTGLSQSVGICYFKECNITYIQNSIDKWLPTNSTLPITATVYNPDDKLSELKEKYFIQSILTLVGLLFLTALSLVATLSKANLLAPFDFVKNAKTITTVRNANKTYERLRVFDGVRFFSAGWVTYGHLCVFPMQFSKNMVAFLTLGKKWSFMFLAAAYYSVDVFFFMSGFLFYFSMQKYFNKKINAFKWIAVSIVLRYFRLLPFWLIATKGVLYIFPYIGSGPWYHQVNSFNDGCETHTWHNLLYINNMINYENGDKMCATQTWYLACDMQFFVLSVLVVFLFNNMKIVRQLIFGGWFVGSCLAQMIVCIKNKYTFNQFVGGIGGGEDPDNGMRRGRGRNDEDDDEKKSNFFTDVYIKGYARITPYIWGIYCCMIFLETSLYKSDYGKQTPKPKNPNNDAIVPVDTKENWLIQGDNPNSRNSKNENENVNVNSPDAPHTPNNDPSNADSPNSQHEIKEEKSLIYRMNIYIETHDLASWSLFIFGLICINFAFVTSVITNHYKFHIFWHAFFNTFNKLIFIGGLAILLHLTYLNKFLFVHRVLSFKYLSIVSRSTYGMYLIHIYFWFAFFSSYNNYYYTNWIDFFLLAIGFYLFSWSVSFVLGILIESPVINITKKYWREG